MMKQTPPQRPDTLSVKAGRRGVSLAFAAVAGAGFMAVLTWSGVVAFERESQPMALAATQEGGLASSRMGQRPGPRYDVALPAAGYEEVGVAGKPAIASAQTVEPRVQTSVSVNQPQRVQATMPSVVPATMPGALPGVKLDNLGQVIMVNGRPWTGEVFDGRPIRAVKTQTMKTTAYSPDERSCGKWADGITASGKSVWMNGGRLVAADRSIPYGTILSIPGYNNGKPVQVWDRGGKIKGNRLDLLYPTHEIALQWGVQDLPVVFWEYADGR